MADTAGSPEAETAEPPRKGSKLLIIMLPVALLLGGGAFYAVYAGLVPLPFGASEKPEAGDMASAEGEASESASEPLAPDRAAGPAPAFVAMEPLIISLGPDARAKHLKLTVQIETTPDGADEVAALTPRIADVFNTFLRAVDAGVLERPSSMSRLRAQMLRRVQLVAPPGTVRDVLIQEFVLN